MGTSRILCYSSPNSWTGNEEGTSMLGPFANGIAAVLEIILNMLSVLIFASIVASWIGDQSNQIVIMVRNLTEPLYRPIRKFTRNLPGPIDWAPMIWILIIAFVSKGVLPWIRTLDSSTMMPMG